MKFTASKKFSPPEIGPEIPKIVRPLLKCVGNVIISRAWKQVRKSHTKNIQALLSAINTCTKYRRFCEDEKLTRPAEVYRISEFLLICMCDISVLAYDVIHCPPSWRQNLYARLLALTLVEVTEDLTQILGSTFKNKLAEAFNRPELSDQVKVLSKGLSQFRAAHEKELRAIRNLAAAHRAHDPEVQLKFITGLDIDPLLDLAREFVTHSNGLVHFITTELLLKMDLRWIVKQFAERERSSAQT
jgi:hypothetical protein